MGVGDTEEPGLGSGGSDCAALSGFFSRPSDRSRARETRRASGLTSGSLDRGIRSCSGNLRSDRRWRFQDFFILPGESQKPQPFGFVRIGRFGRIGLWQDVGTQCHPEDNQQVSHQRHQKGFTRSLTGILFGTRRETTNAVRRSSSYGTLSRQRPPGSQRKPVGVFLNLYRHPMSQGQGRPAAFGRDRRRPPGANRFHE